MHPAEKEDHTPKNNNKVNSFLQNMINKTEKKNKKTKIFRDQQNFCNVSKQGWIKHLNTQQKPIQLVRGEEKQWNVRWPFTQPKNIGKRLNTPIKHQKHYKKPRKIQTW